MAGRDDIILDDENESRIARFVPMVVVLIAFGGFISLAWYAYHTGTQSVNEEDLVVVEADKTPVKEKPLDPGGMKFMNQDKTIYDTFSSNQANNPPKVEHVMPAPEEPMAKPAEAASEPTTWINDKLHQDETDKKKTEQLIAEEKQKTANGTSQTVRLVDKPRKEEDSGITTHIAGKADEKKSEPVEVKAEPKKAEVEPKKPEPGKAAAGTAKVQLGAYGSEAEAKGAWAKLQKKYPELADKTVYIVKADLGAKGIFYRLRAGGVGDAAAAKALCAKLSAKGQACLVP